MKLLETAQVHSNSTPLSVAHSYLKPAQFTKFGKWGLTPGGRPADVAVVPPAVPNMRCGCYLRSHEQSAAKGTCAGYS